jgi:hypothetical protein
MCFGYKYDAAIISEESLSTLLTQEAFFTFLLPSVRNNGERQGKFTTTAIQVKKRRGPSDESSKMVHVGHDNDAQPLPPVTKKRKLQYPHGAKSSTPLERFLGGSNLERGLLHIIYSFLI